MLSRYKRSLGLAKSFAYIYAAIIARCDAKKKNYILIEQRYKVRISLTLKFIIEDFILYREREGVCTASALFGLFSFLMLIIFTIL